MALTAAPLVPGEIQFFDANGNPLAGGLLYTYAPGGAVAKTTWQDSGQVASNANPVTLDAAGRAVIYGSGQYRLVLFDSIGNQIWDSTGEATDPNYIASVLPVFTGDSGSGGAQGLVPAPPSGSAAAGDYLSASGTWAPLEVVIPAAPLDTQAGRMFPQSRSMALSDTLTIADSGGNVTNFNVGATAMTIPSDATANWITTSLTQIMINNYVGSGIVTITPAAGVQLVWPGTSATPAARSLAANGQVVLSRIAVNVWTIIGAGIS